MELVWADKLTPGSLMVNDLIQYNDELIQIISATSDATGDNYLIEYLDTYGERDELTISHDTYVDLYVYIEPND